MKKFVFFAVLSLFYIACQRKLPKREEATLFAEKVMKDALSGMMAELQKQVQEKGAKNSVGYCREFVLKYMPQKINFWEQKAKEELGATSFRFYRVSLKNRNPKNYPDPMQKVILEDWEKTKLAQPTGYESPQEKKMVVLHPIRIGAPVCLLCHGQQIDKETLKEIERLYPQDKATGYSLGDLRGAFVTEFYFKDEFR